MHITFTSQSGKDYLFDALDNEFYQLDNTVDVSQSREQLGLPDVERQVAFNGNSVQEKVEKNAKTLIIELTEQCNLRCTYCVFDDDFSAERNHSLKKINLSVAKESINDFSHRATKDAYIVFYGGEPLLEFDLVKTLADYAASLFGNRVKFSLTTNGTALTREKINYLVEKSFLVTVSIDGAKDIHDSRRITINGKPSWDKIVKNLNYIHKNYEDFYRKNIIFNNVLESVSEIKSANQEVSNNDLLKKNHVRFSFTRQNSIINTNIIISSFQDKLPELVRFFADDDLDNDAFIKDRMTPLLQKIAFRKTGSIAQEGKKICIPFSNRTYIRTNGDIQFCERIGELGKVSHVDDLAKHSQSFLSDFDALKSDDCSKCFAYNFCELCPASFCQDGKFSKDLAKKVCDNNRSETLLAIKLYVELSERNYQFSSNLAS